MLDIIIEVRGLPRSLTDSVALLICDGSDNGGDAITLFFCSDTLFFLDRAALLMRLRELLNKELFATSSTELLRAKAVLPSLFNDFESASSNKLKMA